jgi:hypothetical protein
LDADAVEVDLGPPIPDAGTGWRDSSEPWVAPARGARDCGWPSYAFDLWPASDGLYAFYAGYYGTSGRIAPELDITVNPGGGWTPYYSGARPCEHATPRYLAGAIDGRVIVAGSLYHTGGAGTLAAVTPAGTSALVECGAPPVANAFVVHDRLAYASAAYDTGHVLRFDGHAWTEMPDSPIPIRGVLPLLWADDDDLFLAGREGLVVSRSGSGWYIHDLGTTSDVLSLWGFDGDDVWAGLLDGTLHHFDGATWSEVTWPNVAETGNPCDAAFHAALGLWGSDGVLYISTGDTDVMHMGPDMIGAVVASGDAIVRYDGEFQVIAHWPPTARTACEDDGVKIWRLRGTSANEVFVIAEGGRPDPVTGCKRPFVLWWDGAAFRWI